MLEDKTMKHLRKIFKRILLLLSIFMLIGIGILFGTSYGRELHNNGWEYTNFSASAICEIYILSQKELDKLQDRINHPKWSNSDEHIYKK